MAVAQGTVMRFAILKRVLSTGWLITGWLAFASPLQASHLESATGLDFQREVNSGSSGDYGGGGFGGGISSSTPTYTYVEGANSFNPNNVDWQAFRDASQNFGLPKAGNSGKTIRGGGGFGGF